MSDRDKAKAVLLEAALVAGRSGLQRTNHYKVFWLSHLVNLLQTGLHLTNWPIVKMPAGPGVDAGAELLDELQMAGLLTIERQAIGPYISKPAVVPPTALDAAERVVREHLTSAERESIREAYGSIGSSGAGAASDWSHAVSRSWREASPGSALDVYADLYQDDMEFDELRTRLNSDALEAQRVLGGG